MADHTLLGVRWENSSTVVDTAIVTLAAVMMLLMPIVVRLSAKAVFVPAAMTSLTPLHQMMVHGCIIRNGD